ncbi:MAG: beta-ketoacyl-[acyl-carrier-protein] synthase family protein [Leptospiraceae bacterium]|nr:beta-ketoacyl-[acyl-carrier-protein] synthase family protein [Leptospiraceae bacterium]
MKRVVITGFGIVSAIGNGKNDFWESLAKGKSGIGKIARFDSSTYEVKLSAEVKENPIYSNEIKYYADYDPKVGFAYTAFREAIEQAKIDRLDKDTLLHLGTSLETFDLSHITCGGKPNLKIIAKEFINGNKPPLQFPLDTPVELISKEFGTPGRKLTNCSACVAGAQTIGHAFGAIRQGEFSLAICGGFDSMINPLGIGGFQLLGALTTSTKLGAKACRPFDSERNGTVLGEGAAIFVLESLEKAKTEGKEILAEIVGYGSSLDAYNLTAPSPTGEGAKLAMLAALKNAKLSIDDIHYINAHGTSTFLNDEIEATAIRDVFQNWKNIPVSSTKSLTGHTIGASGPVEMGVCLLPLLKGLIPPNPSLEKVGKGCELNHITQTTKFHGQNVLSNSFGFGGQNATLILKKYEN